MSPVPNDDEDRVAAAFAAVSRAEFLPPGSEHLAGSDRPVRIGGEQTNSQPRTVAAMLRLLDVRPGDRVLDVGAGSGWTTALLAHLTGLHGSVLGVEIEPELAAWGAANVERSGQEWARLEAADPAVLGRPEQAPYDRVLVSAEAGELPRALVEQLADGGVMVVPVAGAMTRVVRDGDALEVSEHGAYAFVPLR